jgi:hypothetical protein
LLLHLLHDHLLRSDVLRSARLPQRLCDMRGPVPCMLPGELLRPGVGVLPGELLRPVREWKLTGLGREDRRMLPRERPPLSDFRGQASLLSG